MAFVDDMEKVFGVARIKQLEKENEELKGDIARLGNYIGQLKENINDVCDSNDNLSKELKELRAWKVKILEAIKDA